MRFEHRAGEKCFVDYAGQTIGVIDRHTGEIRQAQIFVAVLGCSELHLRRSDLDADAAGLARRPCAGAGVLRRRAGCVRARTT